MNATGGTGSTQILARIIPSLSLSEEPVQRGEFSVPPVLFQSRRTPQLLRPASHPEEL